MKYGPSIARAPGSGFTLRRRTATPSPRVSRPPTSTVATGWCGGGVSGWLGVPNSCVGCLMGVLLVAVRSSVGPAMACAALSFVAYDFLVIPPNFSFTIQREEDVLTL
ncbi:hypothetical protein B1218_33725, partial [Pseudomonas ogarae]